jgi:hypothetical protein
MAAAETAATAAVPTVVVPMAAVPMAAAVLKTDMPTEGYTQCPAASAASISERLARRPARLLTRITRPAAREISSILIRRASGRRSG